MRPTRAIFILTNHSWFVSEYIRKYVGSPSGWRKTMHAHLRLAVDIDDLDRSYDDRERLTHLLDRLTDIHSLECRAKDRVALITRVLMLIVVVKIYLWLSSVTVFPTWKIMVLTAATTSVIRLIIQPAINMFVHGLAGLDGQVELILADLHADYANIKELLAQDLDVLIRLDTSKVTFAKSARQKLRASLPPS